MLNPNFANLGLGVLKLESKERINACLKHLHDMPVRKMLRVAAMGALVHKVLSRAWDRGLDYSPLKVDISGIFSRHGDSPTTVFSAEVIDPTQRLVHFKREILKSLSEAGFRATALPDEMNLMMTRSNAWWPPKGTYDPKIGEWSKKGRPRPPLVDAGNLIRDWNKFEWATNVQLEKICIYDIGMMERLPGDEAWEKEMVEVDSIILPEFHESKQYQQV